MPPELLQSLMDHILFATKLPQYYIRCSFLAGHGAYMLVQPPAMPEPLLPTWIILAWKSNHMLKVWDELLIHFQTSTVEPLKFGNV